MEKVTSDKENRSLEKKREEDEQQQSAALLRRAASKGLIDVESLDPANVIDTEEPRSVSPQKRRMHSSSLRPSKIRRQENGEVEFMADSSSSGNLSVHFLTAGTDGIGSDSHSIGQQTQLPATHLSPLYTQLSRAQTGAEEEQ